MNSFYSEDYEKALSAANKILKLDPINTTAFNCIDSVYEKTGNKSLAEKYFLIFNNLIDSILNGGEVGNIEKPFRIITYYEKFAILEFLKLDYKHKVSIREPHYTWGKLDKAYSYGEIVYTFRPYDGKEWVVYFNVSIPAIWDKDKLSN